MNTGSDTMAILPLNAVLLPSALMPLRIFEPRYKQMLADCRDSGTSFGINLIRDGQEVGGDAVPHAIGTEARIVQYRPQPDETFLLLIAGARRYRIERIEQRAPYLRAAVTMLDDTTSPADQPDADESRRLRRLGARLVEKLAETMEQQEEDLPQDIAHLCWFLAARLEMELTELQALLESTSVRDRVRRLSLLIEHGMPTLERQAALAQEVRKVRRGNGDARPLGGAALE